MNANMTDKLIISADIHGNYNAWLTLKSLLKPEDALVIAGDLFDTRYGSYTDPAYSPETIKNDLGSFSHPLHYVYGNCDVPSFCPGYSDTLRFEFSGHTLFVHHGHKRLLSNPDEGIIIQGHTHTASLIKKDRVYMNPGSITSPRNGVPSYGLIQKNHAALIELKTGRPFAEIEL